MGEPASDVFLYGTATKPRIFGLVSEFYLLNKFLRVEREKHAPKAAGSPSSFAVLGLPVIHRNRPAKLIPYFVASLFNFVGKRTLFACAKILCQLLRP